ncbi:N-6 DNA methylase [Halomonas sediminis]
MAFDQTYCMKTLTAATRADTDHSEFIYAFLDAYAFPKATITQIRNGSQRNVASRKDDGHVALKNWLYFMPVRQGESTHEALQVLADEDDPARHKCRFLVVTDYRELTALDTKTDERLEVVLSDLPTQYLFFAPMAGLERTKHFDEASADLKAAAKMGRLFDRLKEVNEFSAPEQLHSLNVFLTRLLFCYFAEDTGIFPKNAFTNVITEASSENGEGLPDLLAQLFRVMNQPESERSADLPAHIAQFPYVNGGLFRDDLPMPEIRGKGRRMMIECGQLAWEAVNPDIFGSMFQAVVDEKSRDALGQHYTSVPNIMKVIRPLFLDKLYVELHKAKGNRKKLEALLERLTRISIFDPAMGSGNFLIISYKELRRLEMAVFRALQEVSDQQEMFMSGIRLNQFYGIEINDLAHEIAQLSLWLAEHQMNIFFREQFGYSKPPLPLQNVENLVFGNSLHIDWEVVCPKGSDQKVYVVGNPPYRGSKNRTKEQTLDMGIAFKGVKGFKNLDFISAWFWKAALYSGENVKTAFVSTNSICQGEQVSLLWKPVLDLGVEIEFAYQPFVWDNKARDKANVHVVIICFGVNVEKKKIYHRLEGSWHCKEVKNISPYLVEGDNTIVSSRRVPLSAVPKIRFGSMANDGGALFLSTDEKNGIISVTPFAKRFIRKFLGSSEYFHGKERWCIWVDEVDCEEAINIASFSRRFKSVESHRLASDREATKNLAKFPYRFGEVRQPNDEYIIVPRHSSILRDTIPLSIVKSEVVCGDHNLLIPTSSLFVFGVLSSAMHVAWLKIAGAKIKSDYRYSAGLVYNTFVWPESSKAQSSEVEKLARKVILERAASPDKTLAELYDPGKMPIKLLETHQALDSAVEKLYRDRPFRDTTERQEYLLARYEALIEAEKASKPSRTKKSRNAVIEEG